jgi:hypothetical protein
MSSRLKWKRVEEGEGKPGDRYKLRVGDLSTAMVAMDGPRWYFYSLLAKAPKNTLFEQPPRTWDDPEGARTAAGAWARGILQQVA